MQKITLQQITDKKKNGTPITMLTAYDLPFARIVDEAGIDIVLVGDSLANVVLGYESTKFVTIEQMIEHTKAVRRGVKNALLVGDMPYRAYQVNINDAAENARRFMHDAGCDAVKVEWFDKCADVVKNILAAKIPVMGHIGLTPQNADSLGGFKVQGRDAGAAKKLIDQALLLEGLGVFSIVLECVPDILAREITRLLAIPTIGIGAGPYCDGQVLVIHDMLGLSGDFRPKFVKRYADIDEQIRKAVVQYKHEVESGIFPAKEHSYSMSEAEQKKILRPCGAQNDNACHPERSEGSKGANL